MIARFQRGFARRPAAIRHTPLHQPGHLACGLRRNRFDGLKRLRQPFHPDRCFEHVLTIRPSARHQNNDQNDANSRRQHRPQQGIPVRLKVFRFSASRWFLGLLEIDVLKRGSAIGHGALHFRRCDALWTAFGLGSYPGRDSSSGKGALPEMIAVRWEGACELAHTAGISSRTSPLPSGKVAAPSARLRASSMRCGAAGAGLRSIESLKTPSPQPSLGRTAVRQLATASSSGAGRGWLRPLGERVNIVCKARRSIGFCSTGTVRKRRSSSSVP
jgi:hypothetical protein